MVCKTYIFVNNNFLSFHSRDLTNNFSRFTNNLVVLLLLLLTNVPNYCLKIQPRAVVFHQTTQIRKDQRWRQYLRTEFDFVSIKHLLGLVYINGFSAAYLPLRTRVKFETHLTDQLFRRHAKHITQSSYSQIFPRLKLLPASVNEVL